MNKVLIACFIWVGGVWTSAVGFPLERTLVPLTKEPSTSLQRLNDLEPQTLSQLKNVHHQSHQRRRHRLQATRRDFFQVGIMGVGSSFLLMPATAAVAAAPPQQPSANVFIDKNFSVDDAKKRFQAARKDLRYLLENYADITKNGGGDAVRNYLGTQGVNSNLYGIQKVLKLLTEESQDIVEYSEAMEEFNAYYYQAEGAAYQSLFAEHSSAKASPESCLATAKEDIVQMAKYMDQLAIQLNL